MNPETEDSREITFEVESPEESAMPGGIVALVRIRNIERNGRPFTFATGHFSETKTVKSSIKESATHCSRKSADATHRQLFHMSLTEAPLTFPSMMSFPCCRAVRLAIPKSENACGWFSLKTRLAMELAIAPGRQIRTAMS
jgi:hypothetical protein